MGPQIFHTRYPEYDPPQGGCSVITQISGEGQFYINSKTEGINIWGVSSVAKNEWLNIEVLLDFAVNVYTIYVNGTLLTNELFCDTCNAAFGTLSFCLVSSGSIAYFDDITISTDSQSSPFIPLWKPGDPVPGITLANENFESFAAGHIFADNEKIPALCSDFSAFVPAGCSIKIISENSNKLLQISGSNTKNAMLRYNTSSDILNSVNHRTVHISFKVKHNGQGTAFIPTVYNNIYGTGFSSVSNRLYNGSFYYFDSTVQMPGIPALNNVRHDVNIIINYFTNRYSVYLDEKLVANDVYFRNEEDSAFGAVSFFISNGTFWLDNIVLTYE